MLSPRLQLRVAQKQMLTPGLVQLFAKHGSADTLAEYVWRNKGALFIGGTLATFVASPEPFLNAAETITTKTLDTAIQPIVAEAASQFPWGLVSVAGLIVSIVMFIGKFGVPMAMKRGAAVAVATVSELREKNASHSTPSSKEKP